MTNILIEIHQLETVRLYPPILALPKSVATPIATLRLPETGRTLTLPKKTILLPSILATQMHPKYWPDEPNIWNPRRWIEIEEDMELSNCHNSSLDSRLAREKIMEPHPGVYLPWSSGVQNCPGRKFAQVEIVVVVATLLREHRLRVELLEKEDFEKAQARLLKCTNDSYQLLVMQMKNADSMKFYFDRVL
jgi:cytochrome P450